MFWKTSKTNEIQTTPPVYPGRSYLLGHQMIFLEYSNNKQIHLLINKIAAHSPTSLVSFSFPLLSLTCIATHDASIITTLLSTPFFIRSNDLQRLFEGIFSQALYILPTGDENEDRHRNCMTAAVGKDLVLWAGEASRRVSSVLFEYWSQKEGTVDLYTHFQHGWFHTAKSSCV
jgi:hypothetical protein